MQQQTPYTRLTWLDRSGSRGYTYNWARPGADSAALGLDLASWGSQLASASDAVLIERTLFYNGVETSPPTPSGSTAIMFASVWCFSTTDAGQFGMLWLPATRPVLALDTGPLAGLVIDTTLSAVTDLVAELTNGNYTNPFGYVLVDLLSAFYVVLP